SSMLARATQIAENPASFSMSNSSGGGQRRPRDTLQHGRSIAPLHIEDHVELELVRTRIKQSCRCQFNVRIKAAIADASSLPRPAGCWRQHAKIRALSGAVVDHAQAQTGEFQATARTTDVWR